jgi:hypothetical protein
MSARFPVLRQGGIKEQRELTALGAPSSVPFAIIEACAPMCHENHDQSPTTLARRGGLSIEEMACVLTGRRFRDCPPLDECVAIVKAAVTAYVDADVTDRVEAETIAKVVRWLRPQGNGFYGVSGEKLADALERGDWKEKP